MKYLFAGFLLLAALMPACIGGLFSHNEELAVECEIGGTLGDGVWRSNEYQMDSFVFTIESDDDENLGRGYGYFLTHPTKWDIYTDSWATIELWYPELDVAYREAQDRLDSNWYSQAHQCQFAGGPVWPRP